MSTRQRAGSAIMTYEEVLELALALGVWLEELLQPLAADTQNDDGPAP